MIEHFAVKVYESFDYHLHCSTNLMSFSEASSFVGASNFQSVFVSQAIKFS